MSNTKLLKPCPFCNGKASLVTSDDEGNIRDEEYEKDAWSGLSYQIRHGDKENPNCPIANFSYDGGIVGVYLYESREEAVKSWNTRYNN